MFKTLLPPNATKLELALEQTMAKTTDLPVIVDTLWRDDECPVELLGYLAWAMSVDDWDDNWTEAVKRKVIASSIYVHRNKGTKAGVQAALEALDLGVKLSEWFEYGGDPFTFRAEVELNGRGLNPAEIQSIFKAIANSKNARSYLESLRIFLTQRAEIIIGMATISSRITELHPFKQEIPDQHGQIIVGMATISTRLTILEAA